MAGAAKKRAQKERQTHRSSPESSKDSNAPASGPPGGFDGPGDPSDDPSRSGSRPVPAHDQHSSHSRQSSNVPSGFEPSAGAADTGPESSHGAPSGSSRAYAPINVGDVNRRLDLPGNAYNLTSEVSLFSFVRCFKGICPFLAPQSFSITLFFPSYTTQLWRPCERQTYPNVLLSSLYEHSQSSTAIVSYLTA